MRYLLFTLLSALLIWSCTKKNSRQEDTLNGVWVRIDNQSGVWMSRAAIGQTTYGDIAPGAVTAYALLSEPLYGGYCNFWVGDIATAAGYGICGTPMPPPFANGFYTFKILPPNQGWFGLEVIR